jgi:hypothetical protein
LFRMELSLPRQQADKLKTEAAITDKPCWCKVVLNDWRQDCGSGPRMQLGIPTGPGRKQIVRVYRSCPAIPIRGLSRNLFGKSFHITKSVWRSF